MLSTGDSGFWKIPAMVRFQVLPVRGDGHPVHGRGMREGS